MSGAGNSTAIFQGGYAFAIVQAIATARGFRRAAILLAAGVAAALAMAPFYFLPLMVGAYTVLIFAIDGAVRRNRPLRSAFGDGWLFGFGYHLVGLYWMAFSFFVQADEFAWMAPIAILGMPAFLGLFTGAATALAAALWRPGWTRVLLFGFAWMLFEYIRGHALTGLPWNLPGQALAGTAAGAQSASLYGVYGLSLIAILASAAPAAFVGSGKFFRGIAVSLAIFAALFVYGAIRLSFPAPGEHKDARVRIIQPNIPQREKIDGALWWRNFERQLALSRGESDVRTFVLWPENGASMIDEVSTALRMLSDELSDQDVLLAGSARRVVESSGAERYFNSLALIVSDRDLGRVVADHYDKHHLVPFGEYLPFSELMRSLGLAQLAPYDDGFSPGPGPRRIDLGGPSFAPLICYEAIFPQGIYPRGERPDWLVAVTNDAWFGDTSGPRQHLDQARLRTIELGLPMARSANTGISALIDARGQYLERIPLYRAGVIEAPLPKALPPTPYARIGDLAFALMMLAAAAAGRTWRARVAK